MATLRNSDTDTTIDPLIIYNNDRRAIFDAGGLDTLDASARTDNVTLNLAPGSLSGKTGNLLLGIADDVVIEDAIGGTGSDTYSFNGTWGNDVITDSDGIGRIVVDQTVLSGGKKTSANTYLSADKKYSYQRNSDGSLVIHQKDSNNAITIRDWSQDKLGVNLSETLFDPTAPKANGAELLLRKHGSACVHRPRRVRSDAIHYQNNSCLRIFHGGYKPISYARLSKNGLKPAFATTSLLALGGRA